MFYFLYVLVDRYMITNMASIEEISSLSDALQGKCVILLAEQLIKDQN